MATDLSREDRIKLIKKAMRDCGQEITREAVKRQYEYETGELYDEDPE